METRTLPAVTDLSSPAPDSPVEALEWLGGTADEVAENLRLRGIRGRRVDPGTCPLANYLNQWWENVSIYQRVSVWHEEFYRSFREGDTPEPCFQFIRKFDLREYPDLLA